MAMNPQSVISEIESSFAEEGTDLSKAPHTKKLIEAIVTNIIAEVQKATVTVPALGLIAPQGPVTGQATGTIS